MDETTPIADPLEEFHLDDDIEEIPTLDPEIAGVKKIKLQTYGGEVEIFQTNNLWGTFAIWWRVTHPGKYEPHDSDESMRKNLLTKLHFEDIMTVLAKKYPKLLGVLGELTDEKEENNDAYRTAIKEGRIKNGYTVQDITNGKIPPEEQAVLDELSLGKSFGKDQAFYFSKAYEVMVPIALELDPGYEPASLTY